jgi:hypothetical protein
MERRNFLRVLVGGVAVAAAARAWPFRVYSFPRGVVNPYLPETYARDLEASVLKFNHTFIITHVDSRHGCVTFGSPQTFEVPPNTVTVTVSDSLYRKGDRVRIYA